MTAFDPFENFAYAVVTGVSGDDIDIDNTAPFPDPATDGGYWITIWDAGVSPVGGSPEIARVTAKSGTTLSLTRGGQGTTPRSLTVGDQVMSGWTRDRIKQIQNVVGYINRKPTDDVVIPDGFSGIAKEYFAPVGSYALEGDAALSIETPVFNPFTIGSSYLIATSPTALYTIDTSTIPEWSTVVDSDGADLSINGMNAALIDIATTGWYVAALFVDISGPDGCFANVGASIGAVTGVQYWQDALTVAPSLADGITDRTISLATEPTEWSTGQQLQVILDGDSGANLGVTYATQYRVAGARLSIIRVA